MGLEVLSQNLSLGSPKKFEQVFEVKFIVKKILKNFTFKFNVKKIRNFFTVKFLIRSVQSTIFICHHKVIKRPCGPKISQNVFSSPNSPEKVLNEIPQMSGTPWKKGNLGLEKIMVTKYGVWDTWDDFSFWTTEKKKLIRAYKKIRKIFTAKFIVKKFRKIFTDKKASLRRLKSGPETSRDVSANIVWKTFLVWKCLVSSSKTIFLVSKPVSTEYGYYNYNSI